MERREYESLAKRETFYFWHVGRREILAEALRRYLPSEKGNHILDIGCGTGGDMLLLIPFGRVVGVDAIDEALTFSAGKGFERLVSGSAEKLPFENGQFDLAVALDVLEHVKDDGAAIREAYRVLKPGGIFLVTVPAYQWLWSQHDEALHHHRRYLKRDMADKLRTAGFRIRTGSYFVMLGLLMNGLRKLRDTLRPPKGDPEVYDVVFSPVPNAILLFILRIEKYLIRLLPLPFGTSIMLVVQKP